MVRNGQQKKIAGTFSQIYIHVVMVVKYRQPMIYADWEHTLYKYISGIVREKGQKLIAVNGMPDHVHLLLGIRPSCCLSDLVREIKKSTNKFINEHQLTDRKFEWQVGFGAFSNGHNSLGHVVRYIDNQKAHHRGRCFREEYIDLLKELEIDYKEEYLFD